MELAAVHERVHQHVSAVADMDVARLVTLYAPDATLYDSAGSDPVVGRDAIGRHFTRWLTSTRRVADVQITSAGLDNSLVVVAFTATPEHGEPVGIVDVMRFDEQLHIVEMCAFAVRQDA